MASAEQNIQLALRLPQRLLRFFARFPPPQIANPSTSPSSTSTSSETITISENTSSSDPNAAASTTTLPLSSSSPSSSSSPPPSSLKAKKAQNPFLPTKNPKTGLWHSPVYSLRRQAELYKLAATHHVLSLMPLSHKHPEVKEQRRIENGLRVQGTGVGKKVKGKAWERSLRGRLAERQRALEGMPAMIKEWKERGHGRGWKRWPK